MIEQQPFCDRAVILPGDFHWKSWGPRLVPGWAQSRALRMESQQSSSYSQKQVPVRQGWWQPARRPCVWSRSSGLIQTPALSLAEWKVSPKLALTQGWVLNPLVRPFEKTQKDTSRAGLSSPNRSDLETRVQQECQALRLCLGLRAGSSVAHTWNLEHSPGSWRSCAPKTMASRSRISPWLVKSLDLREAWVQISALTSHAEAP